MNHPSYQRDAYMFELDTDVVETGVEEDRDFAVTADTIFYPEGGGQPADHGFMDGIEVADVQKAEGIVRHFMDGELALGPVRQNLDWGRRFDHMQQHTGQHLLTAVALGLFGWATTAFHMGPSVSDIELDVSKLESDDLRRLEDAVVEEIRAAHTVTIRNAQVHEMEALGVRSRLLPEGFSGEIRLVEIEGLDLNTCGGTHVRSTAEIDTMALIGTEAMRGGTRLFFVAGDRVRRRLRSHEVRNLQLRGLLDAADDDLPELVELRLAREKSLARERRQLLAELARAEAERLAATEGAAISANFGDRDLPFLQEIGKAILERTPERIVLLTAGSGREGSFLLVASETSDLDLGVAGPEICSILDGRGGGRVPFFQGKATALDRRKEATERLLSLLRPD